MDGEKKECCVFDYKEGSNNFRPIGKNLLTALIIILVWFAVASWALYTRGVHFPLPNDVFARLIGLLNFESLYNHSIYEHTMSSLVRWGAGYMIAVIAGIAIGVWTGVSRTSHDVLMPIVYVIQLIPGLAWIPIALLLFGIGNISTVFMIAMTALAPIVLNVSEGIRSVPKIYIRASEMMGASRLRTFLHVILPASILSIVTGLRIGLANGWRVLIAAEMIVGVGFGLGYSIIQSRWTLDFEAAFVSLIIICSIGLLIEKIFFSVLERKIIESTGLLEGN